jgi:hypothetical protein
MFQKDILPSSSDGIVYFYVSKVLESADAGYINFLTGDNCVRFEILTALNITVFWDMIPGSLINVDRRLRGVSYFR